MVEIANVKDMSSLLKTVKQVCPFWQPAKMRSKQEWLDKLIERSGGTWGYYSPSREEPIEFDVSDVKVRETSSGCMRFKLSDFRTWANGFCSDIVDSDLEELITLTKVAGISCRCVTYEVGVKFSGTMTIGLIKVSLKGGPKESGFYIEPTNALLELYNDRTFGPMWESPDGEPM